MASNKTLNSNNTVFYSTANAGYAVYAATSLLTVRDHIPDANLYLLSSGLSERDKKILNKYDITYHELDLTSAFTRTWDYPIDCYYMFAGPEFLREQGYDYSVYIDGDVLCCSNPLQGLPKIKSVAGVASAGEGGDYSGIFGDDWNGIKRVWSLPQKIANRKRINAGIVYFNNQRMKDISLLNKATHLFQKSLENNIPRKGDDSLFSLLQYVYLSEQDVAALPARYNFVLQFNEQKYPIKGLVFFHFSIDKPWKQRPYFHADASLDEFNPLVKQWRKKYKTVDFSGYIKTENVLLHRVYKAGIFVAKLVAKLKRLSKDVIYWILGYKKSLFTRMNNIKKDPIKLYWWSDHANGIANFGDEITKDILLKIFGYRSIFAPQNEAELVGAGSVLEIISQRKNNNRVYVWGSGFMWQQKHKTGSLEGLNFCAVRGANTRARIDSRSAGVALGDPGLLASIVYKKAKHKTNKIGVVAHFVDSNEPLVKKIENDTRFMVIDVLRSPEEVALNITSCKFVLSSSLHGLIFADSFNIPNIHIQFSNNVAGGTYKFEDYYSATGRSYRTANSSKIFDEQYLETLMQSFQPVVKLRKIQRDLVKSFPNIR